MRRFLIVKPRLDIPFKKTPQPPISNPRLSYVRTFWEKFVNGLKSYHEKKGDLVEVLEIAAWQIDGLQLDKDVITYIPHRIPHQLGYPDNVIYYHQTAFPENFTVAIDGWGPACDFYPLDLNVDEQAAVETFNKKRQMFLSGQVKFPESMPLQIPKHDAVFMAQIPHDESIKFFSDISVKDAFIQTIAYCKEKDLSLFLKLHPANPQSNLELIEIANKNNILVTNSKIQDCLQMVEKVFLVNSGSAFQAILLDKDVIYFGQAEYAQIANKFSDVIANGKLYTKENNKKFIHSYLENTIDVEDDVTFERIEKCLNSLNS